MSDTDVRWRAKKVIQDQSNRLVTDTQIKRWDSKTDPGHTHTKTDITDFPSSMPASDVKAWAKADNKPSYVWNEIGNKPTEFNPSSHKHLKNDITDFPESIKNPLSMSIMLNGGNTEGKDLFTYDGSVAKTVNINYSNIGAAPKEHYHDDRYYTEEETDKLIKGVSTGVFENLTWEKILNKPTVFTPANHTHSKSEINDFPDSLKNPSSITIKLNGGTIEGNNVFTYDGSIAKTIDITAADIGASSIGHFHTVKDIKDFPISMPASDVYDWAKEKFKPSYVWNEIGEKPTEFNPIAHKHVVNEITDFPETMRNPYSISIRLNNGTTEDLDLFTYNGDGEKSINITPIKIDAADRVHTHTRSQITDFPETLRNPAFLTVKFDNMANKSVTSDSYDGSVPKTITVASNIHKHLKEDILDFPDSIKNPKNITLILDNGETTTQDFYDGSEAKTFNVASAKHTHSKIDFTDFPVSIKNPFSVTIVTNDGKTTSSDSYDGSIAKTFNLASAKHVHVKSEITDFPDSIKNPSAITIVTNNGETTSKDTYDGSLSKTFELASAKHVHVKSEITDFPSSIKNPTAITITMNDGTDITKDSYDGSEEKTFDVAKGKHVHVKSEITDFPDSIKNPTAITIITNDGKDISQDSYDGSEGKIFEVADAKHVHVKSEITDFPDSIKNPTAITISLNDGKTTVSDSYDGSKEKSFNAASAKHVHVKSEITDFPSSIKNPASITIAVDDGVTKTQDSYDGSSAKKFDVANAKHVHVKSEITDFPTSIKNPNTLIVNINDGKTSTQTKYDGSVIATVNVASAKHVHVKSEITDFPESIKNPTAITISTYNGTDTVSDSYDGSTTKTFNVASANHTHSKFNIVDFPDSIKNPTTLIINMNDGKNITTDSYDGSEEKTLNLASAKHVHVKSEITDFPASIKNPTAITITMNDGKTIVSDSYDGSSAKKFDVAKGKHVHVKSEITDFPESIKNPTAITITMNDGKNTTTDSYDGSSAKTFDVAKGKHVHVKSEITDFPASIKNPTSITISLNDGKNTTTDSYDGSKEKTFNAASAKHVHVKSEITDFPSSIKNPTAITISLNDGKNITKDSYDGSTAKSFDVAKGKHVHVKSEITDFPASIKNPTSLSIQLNGGAATVYDGSTAKSINITPAGIGASASTHLHDDRYYTESEIDTKLGNISTTLTSHNHTELAGVASPQAVPGKSKDGFMTYHYNVNNGLTNNMPSSNNANAILTISRHAGDYTTQLGFSSDDNIYYRNGVGTTSWKRILDSSNYNNYAPSKTGSGASGTWSINITGKANTAGIADSANAVTWGNVSGKPSTYTPSAHTHTKSQITDFPASLKNPTSLSIQLNGGTATVYDGSNAKSINITPAGIGASASGHTHNYAGSSSVGGSANSAVKLDTSTAGSGTQPVYFSGGKPVACTYSLNKSVPSNAVFTDTNTWRGIQNNLTSDSTNDSLSAAQGKVLKGLVDGKAAASHTHTKSQITDFPTSMPASDVYSWAKASSKPSYSWSEIGSKPSTFTPSSHTHDFVVGSYTGNGGQQKPNYFGTNKVGFLMMNTTVNGNSQYKDWVIMDCYSGTDVGGGVAIGVNRQSLGAYIMRSDATRTAWAESAELLHTKNYTSYTVTKSGGGASGTWGINISGKASTAGTADSANSVAWGNVSGKPSTFTPSSHTHTKSQITDFPTSMPASDVYSWAKASSKPSYSWNEITSKPSTFTPSAHTHNYAGSSSAGGSANSAVKLNSNAGSKLNPIYFSDGKPAACTYTLAKSVPSDAVFTDTNTWRGIQNNLTSNSTSDSLSAAQGKVLKGLIDGKASSSHTHSYLPLSGGNVTGRITRSSGGAWISQRDLAIVYQSFTDSSSACPVVAFKTKSGAWAMGSLAGTDNLYFSYSTDSDYNAGNNNANMISLPAKTGTIALTSDLPTWNTIKPYTAFFGGIDLDTNGAYIYGENNSGNIFFRYKASAGATDYSWANLNDIVNNAYGNLRLSGGTMTGPITLGSSGSIYTGNDGNYGPGSPLNNVVISSWFGVSFTTSCPNQGCTGKTAVGIDCRTGTLKAYDFAISHFCGDDIQSIDSCSIRFTSLTNWGIIKGPNSLRFANVNGAKFRMQDRYCYCDVGFVSMGIWNSSATQAANMYINDQGFIYHTSSASRYKMNIENLTKPNDYSYNILKLNPKQWFDRGETERYAKYLTAEYTKEELDDEFKQLCLSSNITPCYGLIAEDVKEAGLEEFCEFSKDENGNKKIEGVQYDRLPILMIPILRDLVSCMNKILPYAKKGIDDENILKEVEEIEKRFNSFNENDVVNLKYDPETSKIIE